MVKTIDLRTLSEEMLNKKVSDLFRDKSNAIRKEKAIDINNFINKHKDSYFKIVINGINDNGIYIGKISVCTNKFCKLTFLVQGEGYYFANNQLVKTPSFFCNLENAQISVLSECEYQKIANQIDIILLLANKLNNKLIDSYKNGELIKIAETRKIKRPNIDSFFKISCTKTFLKKNQDKTFSELYKTALSAYQAQNKEYETIYEDNKKLIGKYFISKNGAGQIVQIINEHSINFICSLMRITPSTITILDETELWLDAYEITKENFNALIVLRNQIKHLCDNLRKS